jgi:hypothetical protein
VIYSVVPRALAGELYDRLVEHYRDDPDVQVIVDRRDADGRPPGARPAERDRRRRRVKGTFPPIHVPGR